MLIITGLAYALIGIKHKFMQVFLSNGYLAALAVTVLIDYVMKPPISDAIQGAFFVAIFMTGCLYGGGSLIFKEVTEGFGCLLGGFALAMWLLCLKPGGLIQDQTGKGIMIGVFCVAVWSLSFSRHTREYGLIGSTSFAGATAFILGVDCFSGAGLKEFWFYIFELNDNLFPLNTDTYPMTRGMIVELIVIILITIIGVFSQIKLWRIVRARRDRRNAVKLEDERRRDVVEEAIGRHLERQNDKDRTNWERQYGNNLNAKRSTILWTDAHPEKAVTHIMPVEDKRLSSSVESLEMSQVPPNKPRSKYSNRNLRQSTVTVDVIPEEQEDGSSEKRASNERLKALTALDPNAPTDTTIEAPLATPKDDEEALKVDEKKLDETAVQAKEEGPSIVPLPFIAPAVNQARESVARSDPSEKSQDPKLLQRPKRISIPGSKRSSLASMLSMSPRLSVGSDQPLPSESVEKLIIPSPRSSRASSVAATLDEEDRLSITLSDVEAELAAPQSPTFMMSTHELEKHEGQRPVHRSETDSRPRSPSQASVDFEEDPEALPRSVQKKAEQTRTTTDSTVSGEGHPAGSASSDAINTTEQSSVSEGLTTGALEQIPKQTSHVVLSYRTNEWAKHIAEADAPMFAEPDQIDEEDGEVPVQLAPLVAPTEQPKTPETSKTPPPPHVASAHESGITAVVAEPTKIANPSAGSKAPLVRPSLKGKRSSTLNHKNSFIAEPIHEDSVTNFAAPARPSPIHDQDRPKSPPAGPYRLSSSTNLSSIPMAIQGTPSSAFAHPYMVNRSNSYTNIATTIDPRTRSQSSLSHNSRSSSMMSGVVLPMRSETRLDSYDSRQPERARNQPQERQRREALLTDWRISQQQGGLISQIPNQTVEQRRAQMLLDKEHRRMMEDQQKVTRQQQQMAMDQVMRRPDMQDAHREAMRRMQAGANKKLTL